MKRKIIIVTHSELAKGLKNTAEFFSGKRESVYAVCAYTNSENSFPTKKIEDLLTSFNEDDQIFIITDLLGGSVNQHCLKYDQNKKIKIITGTNLAFLLSVILEPEGEISEKRILSLIEDARSQLRLMHLDDIEINSEDE